MTIRVNWTTTNAVDVYDGDGREVGSILIYPGDRAIIATVRLPDERPAGEVKGAILELLQLAVVDVARGMYRYGTYILIQDWQDFDSLRAATAELDPLIPLVAQRLDPAEDVPAWFRGLNYYTCLRILQDMDVRVFWGNTPV